MPGRGLLRTVRRALVRLVAAGVLIAAIVVLGLNVVRTSSARIAASTDTTGFFTAGVVVLDHADDSRSLHLDADNLYPGLETSGCVDLEYSGNVPVDLRLHGGPSGGTGLDAYLDVDISLEPGGSCDQPPVADADSTNVRDRLQSFGEQHEDYLHGLALADVMAPGDHVAVRLRAWVVDDNRAQGLTTEFVLVVEARPA